MARHSLGRARGRSLSPRMSWVALLSDLGTNGLDELAASAGLSRSERIRVRVLRDRSVEDWAWLARRRAATRRYSVRDAYVESVLGDHRVVRSGISATADYGLELTARRGSGEVYVTERDADALAQDHLLRLDPIGALVVHVVDDVFLFGRFGDEPVMTAATIGVDLAENDDARTKAAGLNLLRRIASG